LMPIRSSRREIAGVDTDHLAILLRDFRILRERYGPRHRRNDPPMPGNAQSQEPGGWHNRRDFRSEDSS